MNIDELVKEQEELAAKLKVNEEYIKSAKNKLEKEVEDKFGSFLMSLNSYEMEAMKEVFKFSLNSSSTALTTFYNKYKK